MGEGTGLQHTSGDALPFSSSQSAQGWRFSLGPAGPSWESGQAATSLWGWQLLGQSQLTSKPGSKLQFLMKDCELGIDTFNCLGTVSDPMWAPGTWR